MHNPDGRRDERKGFQRGNYICGPYFGGGGPLITEATAHAYHGGGPHLTHSLNRLRLGRGLV